MDIVCMGAHPDDAEFHAGATLAKWAAAGHRVTVVSLTNGNAGHHEMPPDQLARRRAEEVEASSAVAGFEHLILDIPDGRLVPTLELREQVIRIIRRCGTDIVLTHRPCDYHPDHRAAGQVVQDAAFMVTVPHCCPDVPALKRNPVFLYMMDRFTRPIPFQADIAVAVDSVMDLKWAMLDAMESQFYEWLPWLAGESGAVPGDRKKRKQWLIKRWGPVLANAGRIGRPALDRWYGVDAGSVQFAELFEVCEYGHMPSNKELMLLFPFLARKDT